MKFDQLVKQLEIKFFLKSLSSYDLVKLGNFRSSISLMKFGVFRQFWMFFLKTFNYLIYRSNYSTVSTTITKRIMSNIFVSDRKIELSAKCFRVSSTKGHKGQQIHHPTVPETIKFNITHGFPKLPKSFWLSFEATMSRNTVSLVFEIKFTIVC